MELSIDTTNQIQPIKTGVDIFDNGAFSQMYRISEALAQSSLIPESLRMTGNAGNRKELPLEKVVANCLLVVEQSARWGLSPFAVIQCASVIHGRLMWEGKLVSAVLESKLGIKLSYAYEGQGEGMTVIVSGTLPGEDEPRTITGSVKQWKTTGNNSPWSNPADYERQLAYRGARDWARRHAPAVMLGVVTIDEAQDFQKPVKQVTGEILNPFEEPEEKKEEKSTPSTAKAEPTKHKRKGQLMDLQKNGDHWKAVVGIKEKLIEFLILNQSLGDDLSKREPLSEIEITFIQEGEQFVIVDFLPADRLVL